MSEQPAKAPAAPRSNRTLYMAVAAALLLGAGGAFYWTNGPGKVAAAPAAPAPPPQRGLVTFEPFVVNLADAGATTFLRAAIRLVVGSPEQSTHLQEDPVALMQARSAILELLTTQKAAALVTPEGKAELRKSIAERVGHDGAVEVVDVLFTEFVVQF